MRIDKELILGYKYIYMSRTHVSEKQTAFIDLRELPRVAGLSAAALVILAAVHYAIKAVTGTN